MSFAPLLLQARGSDSIGGTIQNKYVNFFYHMDEKPDIDIKLIKVFVAKTKHDFNGSKNYLHNLDLFKAPFSPKVGVAQHYTSSHNDKTDNENEMKHQFMQEVFVSNMLR